MKNQQKTMTGKYVVVLSIMLIIACFHILRIGSYLHSSLFQYYYSYFSDIVLPFGAYFLLCLNDFRFPILRNWFVKCIVVFGVASFAEMVQLMGIHLLGATFDPLDLLMYGIGAFMAALVEKQLFERLFSFWLVRGD